MTTPSGVSFCEGLDGLPPRPWGHDYGPTFRHSLDNQGVAAPPPTSRFRPKKVVRVRTLLNRPNSPSTVPLPNPLASI